MQIYNCCLVKNCNKHAPIKNFLKLDIYRCNSSQCQLTLIFATSIHQISNKMNEKWNVNLSNSLFRNIACDVAILTVSKLTPFEHMDKRKHIYNSWPQKYTCLESPHCYFAHITLLCPYV